MDNKKLEDTQHIFASAGGVMLLMFLGLLMVAAVGSMLISVFSNGIRIEPKDKPAVGKTGDVEIIQY